MLPVKIIFREESKMNNMRIKVSSQKFDDKKVAEIQNFVDELYENNYSSFAIAMEVKRIFKCSIGLKYSPKVDYIELICATI